GLLFSTPEYAHGIPGALKNALDWLVGGSEFIYKRVALLNPSPTSTYAQASLRETITVMSGKIIEEGCITLPLRGKTLQPEAIADHAEWGPALRRGMEAFLAALLVPEIS